MFVCACKVFSYHLLLIIYSTNETLICLSFAHKSVSQTLHTTAPSLLRPLLDYHLMTASDSEAVQDSFTILRRVLTALTHHCKNAEQFLPIMEILLEHLARLTEQNSAFLDNEHERLRRLLEVLTVPCSVRSGSRLTASHISTILSQLLTLPISDTLRDAIVKLSVSCLTAGQGDLGLGRRTLERAWKERPRVALQITGALMELGWGGWQLAALPLVVSRSMEVLEGVGSRDEEALSVQVLEVLADAYKAGKLGSIDQRWKERLSQWVQGRFAKWENTGAQVGINLHAKQTCEGYRQLIE